MWGSSEGRYLTPSAGVLFLLRERMCCVAKHNNTQVRYCPFLTFLLFLGGGFGWGIFLAIFHYSNNVITRSKKGAAAKLAGARGSTAGDQRVAVMSVVAAAAYRAGEDLTLTWEKNPFTRYLLAVDPEKVFEGLEGDKSVEIMTQASTRFDYSRKRDIAFKEIMAPEGAPDWVFNRNVLWNKVENVEKRVDSALARHIDAALPIELDLEACKTMVRAFVKQNFTDKGMVADVAFHDMGSHNPHAHILLTTREIEGDDFKDKKCAAWQATYNHGNGRVLVSNGCLEAEREAWAMACNKALERAGNQQRIDHRSFKRQGIDKIPTFHIGRNAWYLEKIGRATNLMSRFKDIVFYNAAIEKLKAFQKAMQVKPFYKISVLQKAQEALHSFFERSPQHSMAYSKPPPDIER